MKTLPADAENLKKIRESQVESLRTPTPWKTYKQYNNESIWADKDTLVADCAVFSVGQQNTTELNQANAAFIVEAVNSYESDKAKIKALVEALEGTLHPLAMSARKNEGTTLGDKSLAHYDLVRAALATA